MGEIKRPVGVSSRLAVALAGICASTGAVAGAEITIALFDTTSTPLMFHTLECPQLLSSIFLLASNPRTLCALSTRRSTRRTRTVAESCNALTTRHLGISYTRQSPQQMKSNNTRSLDGPLDEGVLTAAQNTVNREHRNRMKGKPFRCSHCNAIIHPSEFTKWLSTHRSEASAAASRANGAKGGRPRKTEQTG